MQGPLKFRAATPADLPSIEMLVSHANLPLDGVAEHTERFLLAFRGEDLVGAAAIEPYGEHGLLRSVAVREDQRGTGVGVKLVTVLIEQARTHGLLSLVLLTTTAEKFFPRFGFQRIGRTQLPANVHASRELQGACPASSVVMQLQLQDVPA